jgi:D-threo-aldose 1-dehydrogenase
VLSTKIGRLIGRRRPRERGGLFKRILPFVGVYDYSYDGVMRSVEDSLQRLGTHRIDVLLVHDVDVWTHGSEEARSPASGR